MSSDFVAWVIAIALGIAVVVLGLRRNLSETTRNWLPRFGGDPERGPRRWGSMRAKKGDDTRSPRDNGAGSLRSTC
jgi:hypothetical protein